MTELIPQNWASYFRTVGFCIRPYFKGVLLSVEIVLLVAILTLAFSVDVAGMSHPLDICQPSLSYIYTANSVGLRSFQRNLLSELAQTHPAPPSAKEGILRIKGQPVSILAVFVAPAVALLVALTAMTFLPPEKFSGSASFFLLGFLGVGVAAIVTAILGQFEEYSPAIQRFCLVEGFIAGALASLRRLWSSGSLTETRPKGGRAL